MTRGEQMGQKIGVLPRLIPHALAGQQRTSATSDATARIRPRRSICSCPTGRSRCGVWLSRWMLEQTKR